MVSGLINPYVTVGLSSSYHLDKSNLFFRDIRSNFSFLDEIYVSKQNSPRWDAAFCGISSGDYTVCHFQ